MIQGLATVLGAAVLFFAPAARATAITQANGDPIPTTQKICADPATHTPGGLAAVFASATCDPPGSNNLGAPCNTVESCAAERERVLGSGVVCETTWLHGVNDDSCAIDPLQGEVIGLNPWTDVQSTYNTFEPLSCDVTFTVVSRGTAMFQDVFGWYNVRSDGPPAPDDLHVMLACDTPVGSSVAFDVRSDPAYLGGPIGYFLLTPEDRDHPRTCAGGDCCASLERYHDGVGYLYYTEPQYNPEGTLDGKPYVHFIGYDSRLTPSKFYFAWEDLHSPTGSDFTDVVISVEGAECSGGGKPCEVEGALGACSQGRTTCRNGAVVCTPLLTPQSEVCNGVDEDCDGVADDAAPCPVGEICFRGRCQAQCSTGEFPCGVGRECDRESGLCVEAQCLGVTCPEGETCRGGACTAPCAGVICPRGQTCLAGECLDLCEGVSCAPGDVCVDGACTAGCAQCGGLFCESGASCDPASGRCSDQSCAAPCPEGQHCAAGDCVDACAGVVCPQGATCSNGECGGALGGAGAPPIVIGSGGSASNADAGAAGERAGSRQALESAGCGCSVPAGSGRVFSWLVAAASLALSVLRRRTKLGPL